MINSKKNLKENDKNRVNRGIGIIAVLKA